MDQSGDVAVTVIRRKIGGARSWEVVASQPQQATNATRSVPRPDQFTS